MRFRGRRRGSPPLELQPSLDRLAELVSRVVDLLDDGRPRREPAARGDDAPRPQAVWLDMPKAPRDPEPAPPESVPEREPEPEPEPEPQQAPTADGWLAFVHAPDGYRLLPRTGASPVRGAVVELEGSSFRVVKTGASPLPGDGRRCVYLEGEERPAPARTSDG